MSIMAAGSAQIYKVSEELIQRQTIPVACKTTLEECLAIAYNPLLGRQPRGKVQHTSKEIRSHYGQRKANIGYYDILFSA
jgi:hypothetical protein